VVGYLVNFRYFSSIFAEFLVILVIFGKF